MLRVDSEHPGPRIKSWFESSPGLPWKYEFKLSARDRDQATMASTVTVTLARLRLWPKCHWQAHWPQRLAVRHLHNAAGAAAPVAAKTAARGTALAALPLRAALPVTRNSELRLTSRDLEHRCQGYHDMTRIQTPFKAKFKSGDQIVGYLNLKTLEVIRDNNHSKRL